MFRQRGNAEQSQVKKCAVEGWCKIFWKHNTTIAVVRKERVAAAHAKRRIKGIVSLVTILVAVMFSQRHLPEGTILFTPFGCSYHVKQGSKKFWVFHKQNQRTRMNILLYSLVLLSLLFISTTALESSCIKTFNVKGKQYTADLTGLFSNRSVTAQGADGYFYSINPCSSIPQPASSCPGGTFLGYQLSRDQRNCFPIAQGISPTIKSMELIDPDDASGGLLIKMNTVHGTYNRGAEMKMYCKVNAAIVDATVEERKDGLYTSLYVFNVKSGYACLGASPTPPKKGCCCCSCKKK